jgi:hypothetical protein
MQNRQAVSFAMSAALSTAGIGTDIVSHRRCGERGLWNLILRRPPVEPPSNALRFRLDGEQSFRIFRRRFEIYRSIRVEHQMPVARNCESSLLPPCLVQAAEKPNEAQPRAVCDELGCIGQTCIDRGRCAQACEGAGDQGGHVLLSKSYRDEDAGWMASAKMSRNESAGVRATYAKAPMASWTAAQATWPRARTLRF